MPRGGRRPGAGRKPKNGGARVVDFPGGGTSAAEPAGPPDVDGGVGPSLLDPPEDLADALKAVWRMLAPLAIEQRTLVASTVPGFRNLCRLFAFQEELGGRVERLGSEAALKHFTKLDGRLDAALARFKLTAFGKPADAGAKRQPTLNPFSRVAQ